jgi:transcriptional regulator with XRE-family HTH domain
MSPLRKIRKLLGQTLQHVADATNTDTGNLSRIERGDQTPSKDLTERLVRHFGGAICEMQILFPERYSEQTKEAA